VSALTISAAVPNLETVIGNVLEREKDRTGCQTKDFHGKSGMAFRGAMYHEASITQTGQRFAIDADWMAKLFASHPTMKGREFYLTHEIGVIVEPEPFPTDRLELYANDEHVATVVLQ
jgi:hypothetical protein